MIHTIGRVLTLAVFGLFGLAFTVQTVSAVTLDEAVVAAIRSDERLESSTLSIRAREAALDEARSSYRPVVALQGAFRRQDEPYTFIQPQIAIPLGPPIGVIGVPETEIPLLGRDTLVGELNVTQVLYAGGRRKSGVRQARMGVRAAETSRIETERAIRSEIEQLYIQRWHAEQVLGVSEDAQMLLSALRSLTDALLGGGSPSLTRKDSLRAALAEQKLIGLQAQVRAGHEQAARLLAELADVPPDADLADPYESFAADRELANGNRDALNMHPQLRLLEIGADIAAAEAKSAQGERRPVLQAVAGYRAFDNDLDAGLDSEANRRGWRIGLEFHMPIYDGGSARSKVSRATFEHRSRRQQYEFAHSALTARHDALLASLRRQEAQLVATDQAVNTAQQLESLTSRSVGQDQEGIEERIETTIFLALAQVDHLNAQRDRLLTLSALRQLIGTR